MKLAWQTDGQNLGYERPENKYAKDPCQESDYSKWFIEIYSAFYGETMSVSISMGTNMVAAN